MVNAKGHPNRVQVKQSSGFRDLDEAAVKAVQKWDFEPARLGKRPVDVEAEVPVRFRLRNGD